MTNPELQKKDTKELNLLKEIDKNRAHRTGYHFINHSNLDFRQILLKRVQNEFTTAEYKARKTWNSCRWPITV